MKAWAAVYIFSITCSDRSQMCKCVQGLYFPFNCVSWAQGGCERMCLLRFEMSDLIKIWNIRWVDRLWGWEQVIADIVNAGRKKRNEKSSLDSADGWHLSAPRGLLAALHNRQRWWFDLLTDGWTWWQTGGELKRLKITENDMLLWPELISWHTSAELSLHRTAA